MAINKQLLEALGVNLQALFKEKYGEMEAQAKYKSLVLEVPSTGAIEDYRWVGSVPSMVEFKDERTLRTLLAEGYKVVNKTYESTIQVSREDIEDDRIGVLAPRIMQLAERAAAFPNHLIFSLLDVGDATKTFDDIEFFADTRVLGESGNIDNKLAGSGVDTGAHIRTDIQAAVAAMAGYKDDRGEPLELVPDTIVCPTALYLPILDALLPTEAGNQRVEAKVIRSVIQSGRLTDANDWYLFCTTSSLKPFILQVRKAAEFVSMDKPDSPNAFMRRQFLYGVDCRYGAAFLDPRVGIMIVNG